LSLAAEERQPKSNTLAAGFWFQHFKRDFDDKVIDR
jgi:hypothetical protein